MMYTVHICYLCRANKNKLTYELSELVTHYIELNEACLGGIPLQAATPLCRSA